MGLIVKLVERKFLKKVLAKTFLKDIAEDAADSMRIRVLKGYAVNKSRGAEGKFLALKPSTIKARQRKKRNGELASGVSAKRNSLIETGQLTDSITGTSKSGEIILSLKDNRNDGIGNNELASWQEKKNRPFFHVSAKEYIRIVNDIRKEVKKVIRKL